MDKPSGGQRCDLVLEGGGVRGVGLAGAFSLLEERGYEPGNLAGTSAGAITAALIAAGYRSTELQNLALGIPYAEFLDKGWEDVIPLAGPLYSLLFRRGLYQGRRFYQWMQETLARKGVYTFKDLRTDSNDPRWKSRLQVIVSDVTTREMLVLPRDAWKLGLDPDTLEVAFAVRMSMSLPLFFEPVVVKHPGTGEDHVLVDGGLLSNFPVWLFDCNPGDPPEYPTFGLHLVDPAPERPLNGLIPFPRVSRRGPFRFGWLLQDLLLTMLQAHDRQYIAQEQFVRTIPIEVRDVYIAEFGIKPAKALALYESGRQAARRFLETWDHGRYVSRYRSGMKPPGRREGLMNRDVLPRTRPEALRLLRT